MRAKLAVTGALAALAVAIPPAAAQDYSAAVWNGRAVESGQHQAVAAVLPVEGICTGTLIHPRWLLTAAHCLHDAPAAPLWLGLGSVDAAAGFGESFTSRLHLTHPRYEPRTGRFDFALVRLPSAAAAVPVTLAGSADELLWQPESEASIVGWGALDGADRGAGRRLREGFTSVAPDASCARVHRTYDPASMLCAHAAEADACRGDSGGPLFAVTEDRLVQIGVTSFGMNCDESVVGVYAWLPAARSWIDRVVADGRVPAFATDAGLLTSTERIRRGRGVTIRAGLFRYRDGAPLIQQRVEILRRPRGTTTWRVAARRTTNLHGLVRFRDEPRRDMQYALRHRGTAATKPSRSPARTVRVVAG